MQPAAEQIWAQKYRLRGADGTPLDATPQDTLDRVARALAAGEADAQRQQHWYEEFRWALSAGAIPAGRILANAGARELRPGASLVNCTVSGTIADTLGDILAKLQEAGLTLQAGCGIGYDFSTLRPLHAQVTAPVQHSSGAVSFMALYDSMCATIASSGARRGAQMATFDIGHPDIETFVSAKAKAGHLSNFNLSVLVGDDFMAALDADADWPLAFPIAAREALPSDRAAILWRDWPLHEGYHLNDAGQVACRVHRRVRARALWEGIMQATWQGAEPGIVLIDRVNAWNNNWFCEAIRATNPCGEQPLPPYGACLLGSVDLSRFVSAPFSAQAAFQWDRFVRVVRVFTRLLDNAIDVSALPLPAQRAEILRKRRHGMGILGLGTALAMLRIRYGSAGSLDFTAEVCRLLAITGWQEALALAREKGPAPLLREEFEITPALIARQRALSADGVRPGDRLPGRVLHARYSRYMQRIAREIPDVVAALAEVGARFTHHSSIAPTGTISLALADNASSGIEPSFAHRYLRSVTRPGRRSRETVEVCSRELLAWHEVHGSWPDPLPDYFVNADDIAPGEHVAVQAAAQAWIDSSISKTITLAQDLPLREFADVYTQAWQQGLKGCTTYRFNPAVRQGVLFEAATLAQQRYRFKRASGASFELRGDEPARYAGEALNGAELFAAILEQRFADLGLPDPIVQAEVVPAAGAPPSGAPPAPAADEHDALRLCPRCGERAVVWLDACSYCCNCSDSRCD